MLPYKRNTRRYLALKLRDVYGISAADIVVLKSLTDCLLNTAKVKKCLMKTGLESLINYSIILSIIFIINLELFLFKEIE